MVRDSSAGEANKSIQITFLRQNSSASKAKEEQNKPTFVKQVLKVNSNANNSVEETRDGSIIFVGTRQNTSTVERVRAKRDPSGKAEDGDKNEQPKPKTKMLIAAH